MLRMALYLLGSVLISLFMATLVTAQGLSDGDRQRLLAHLEMTESWLVSELVGLSPEQTKFRMTPESWTITEVVEHLAIAEPQYWDQLNKSMQRPPSTEKPQATDAAILWYGIDRTNRAKTGEARVPKGKWSDVKEPLAEFRKLRATMKQYANKTTDSLRFRMLIDGNMDVYQWFLMISSHSQRHILQIREIKAHSDYPRASGPSS
jgi:DinB superfamily